ncbi:MAG TPA: PspC domain-containing protein [Flexivirga sp.]|uniref:PspC domain-containing protein n=1 Tax=Flexivirga sp. TaxID=1962927 RepID=UPI002BB545A8|nr:PspC domain-containing protein [Flexivirga sp.]HWC22931.1 PspC domain-containing protein [Flexivirga sp.]
MTQQTHPGHRPPHQQHDALDRLFAAARRLGVVRASNEKWLGGVAAGLARRWAVDPLIVRAGLILITCIFGIGLPAYLIAWTLLPDEGDEIVAEKAVRNGHLPSIALCIAAVVLSVGGFGAFWSIGSGWGLSGQALGLGLIAWAFLAWNGHGPGARRDGESTHDWTGRLADGIRTDRSTTTTPTPTPTHDSTPSPGNRAAAAGAAARAGGGIDLGKPDLSKPGDNQPYVSALGAGWASTDTVVPTRPKRRRLGVALTFAILGISVLAGAFTALALVGTSHGDSALQLGLAAGAAVAALALVIGGLAGRRGGVLAALATVAALLALATSAAAPKGMPWTGTVGDEAWRPTSVAAGTQHNFAMRIGDGRLDLSGLRSSDIPRDTTLHARVNVGQLTITLPADTTVRVKGYAHIGQLEVVRGRDRISGHGGIDARHTFTVGHGAKVIDLDARVGVGNITIKEAS